MFSVSFRKFLAFWGNLLMITLERIAMMGIHLKKNTRIETFTLLFCSRLEAFKLKFAYQFQLFVNSVQTWAALETKKFFGNFNFDLNNFGRDYMLANTPYILD